MAHRGRALVFGGGLCRIRRDPSAETGFFDGREKFCEEACRFDLQELGKLFEVVERPRSLSAPFHGDGCAGDTHSTGNVALVEATGCRNGPDVRCDHERERVRR